MSKWSMRGHFRYLRFKTFPMTTRTPQCEVFWALLSNPKHLGVPEDFKSPTLGVLGFTPTLGQSGVAIDTYLIVELKLNPIIAPWHWIWITNVIGAFHVELNFYHAIGGFQNFVMILLMLLGITKKIVYEFCEILDL
jgi:hypothetical protein